MVQDWGIAGQPGSDDVITGRRSGTKANGGNKKFRLMISEKLSQYLSVQDCMKKDVRIAIHNSIHEKGGKFITLDDRVWKEITLNRALVFIQTAFDSKKRPPRSNKRVAGTVSGLRPGVHNVRQSRRIREKGHKSTKTNTCIKSFIVPNCFAQRPDIANACEEICNNILDCESHHPDSQSQGGVALAAGKANVGAPIEINVERSSYLRQNFGMDDTSKISLHPEILYRFQYGTGSGRRSHGICDSHHVTRPFTEPMVKVATAIKELLHETFDECDPDSLGNLKYNEDYNHMVNLNYYDKGQGKVTTQIQLHRDQRFGSTGNFLNNQNTQQENTATVVINIGDTRKLHMQAFRDNKNKKYKCTQIDGANAHHVFELNHGSMFVLHCDDEQPKIREELDKHDLSYFKHGGVSFGGTDEFSIGLAYRVSACSQSVRKKTGRLCITKEEAREKNNVEARNHIGLFMQNKSKWKMNDHRRMSLYRNMRNRFFNKV